MNLTNLKMINVQLITNAMRVFHCFDVKSLFRDISFISENGI